MKEALLLVFANKQDIPGALKPQDVQDALKLNQLKDRIWYVVPSCATTGEGLFEGLVSILLFPVTANYVLMQYLRAGFQTT